MLKILLTGKNGQMGWELERSLSPLGEVVATDRSDLDLASRNEIRAVIRSIKPDLIINTAAFNDLDRAEQDRELAFAINAEAPGTLAEEAVRCGASLIHFSTDYVFDGLGKVPYQEQDPPSPLNVYGESKLAGEKQIQHQAGAFIIIRTAWLYSFRRPCFPMKVLAWMRNNKQVFVAVDQIGNPTWCHNLATTLSMMLARFGEDVNAQLKSNSGIYHLAGRGIASRFEWAKETIRLDPAPEEWQAQAVQPGQSQDFNTIARRPQYTVLDCSKFETTFQLSLCDWRTSMNLAMAGA